MSAPDSLLRRPGLPCGSAAFCAARSSHCRISTCARNRSRYWGDNSRIRSSDCSTSTCELSGPAFAGFRATASSTWSWMRRLVQVRRKRRTLASSSGGPSSSTRASTRAARIDSFSCASRDAPAAIVTAIGRGRAAAPSPAAFAGSMRAAYSPTAACSLACRKACTAPACPSMRRDSASRNRNLARSKPAAPARRRASSGVCSGSTGCAASARSASLMGPWRGTGAGGGAGHRRHLHAPVQRAPPSLAFDATGCSAPKAAANTCAGRHALLDQRARHRQRALGRQLQVVGEAAVAVLHRLVVGEAADHQHLVALAQVHAQRMHQALAAAAGPRAAIRRS